MIRLHRQRLTEEIALTNKNKEWIDLPNGAYRGSMKGWIFTLIDSSRVIEMNFGLKNIWPIPGTINVIDGWVMSVDLDQSVS